MTRVWRAVPLWQWVAIVALLTLAAFQTRLMAASMRARAVTGNDMQPPRMVVGTRNQRPEQDDARALVSMSEASFYATVKRFCEPGPLRLRSDQALGILRLVDDRQADADVVRASLMVEAADVLHPPQVVYLREHPGQAPFSTEDDPMMAVAIAELGLMAGVDPTSVSPDLPLVSSIDRQFDLQGSPPPEALVAGLLMIRRAPPSLTLTREQAHRLLSIMRGYDAYLKSARDMRRRIVALLDEPQRQFFVESARQQEEQRRAGIPAPWVSVQALAEALRAGGEGCWDE